MPAPQCTLRNIPTPSRSGRRPCLTVETTPPAALPSEARSTSHMHASDDGPDRASSATITIWRPADDPIRLTIPQNSSNDSVTAALQSAAAGLQVQDLVPVFPLWADALHCVSKPQRGYTVLIHPPQADMLPIATTIQEGDSAQAVCERIRHSACTLLFEHRPWLGAHHGRFTGMRLQLAPRQPPASPAAPPTVISLSDSIAWQQPRAQAFGVCHHMLTDLAVTFHLHTLSRDLGATSTLHPAARLLVDGLPPWHGSSLKALALYTDGSYCNQPPSASWAVAVFGCDGQDIWHWCGYRSGVFTPQALAAWGSSAFPAEVFALAVAQGIIFAAGLPNAAIFYDASAAYDVSACSARASRPTDITSAARSLTALNRFAGRAYSAVHISSHSGNPGNELADSLTKISHRFPCWDQQMELEQLFSNRELSWLWVLFDHGRTLPHLDVHGFAEPQVSTCFRSQAQTPAQAAQNCSLSLDTQQQLQLRCATYNTLSLKGHIQQKALAMLFQQYACSVIGLQETRLDNTQIQRFGVFTAYTAPSVDGQDGCQLWVNFGQKIGTSPSGNDLFLEANTFIIHHATRSQLIVSGAAGSLRFLFVVAHAPTDQRPKPEAQAWWDQLAAAIKQAPRGHMPVYMIDANAHFSGGNCTASADVPDNLNATLLQSLANASSLALSATIDPDGHPLTTWISPKGDRFCIDFLAMPDVWQTHCVTSQPKDFPDAFAGIDHFPVFLDVDVCLNVAVPPARRLSSRALRTAQGQQAIRDAWQTLPEVPWAVDVDSHLQLVNQHLYAQVRHVTGANSMPRAPAISSSTLSLLRVQRGHRRLIRRISDARRRIILSVIIKAWRSGTCAIHAAQAGRQIARLQFAASAAAASLQALRARIKHAFAHDQAVFSREMLTIARSDGDLHGLLRSVLKTGRRYKAPPALPVLRTPNGESCQDRPAFLKCMGDHFATAERATCQNFTQLHACIASTAGLPHVQVAQLPTLESLASGFAGLKLGKAPGVSGLPAEIFCLEPFQAAKAHFPILLKTVANGRGPLLWRGGTAVPIAKPGKDVTTVKGWRFILLLEPSQKALGAAIRPALLDALQSLAFPGLAGGRKGLPLSLPSLLVSLHVSWLCQHKESGGVLFLDGESAFYNTVRSFLHPLSPEGKLLEWAQHLPEMHDFLRSKDLLQEGGVPEEMRRLLHTLLEGTWYTTDPHQRDIYRTTYGTVPGAPLADILFVITYTVFVEAFQNALCNAGLLCTLPHASSSGLVAAPIPTWLDDSAVLIHSQSADSVEKDMAQATAIARRLLHCIGIPLNLTPGKSEALIVINGKAMRAERRRLLVEKDCHIPLPEQGSLHITDHYVHLGTHVNYRASPAADLARRAQLAEGAFKPLQRRLLPNRHLTLAERARLLEGMVLQKFLFGLERWHLSMQRDWQSFHTHYMSFLRRSVRPLLGVSSKYMSDLQVATVLHSLLPEESRRMQLTRALWQAVQADIPYLHCSLLRESTWLRGALECCNHILQALGEPPLTVDSQDGRWREHFLERLPCIAPLCQKYRKHCCSARQALADDTLASFRYRADAERKGVLLVHLLQDTTAAPQPPSHACPACAKLFRSRSAMASHQQKVHGSRPLPPRKHADRHARPAGMNTATTYGTGHSAWPLTRRLTFPPLGPKSSSLPAISLSLPPSWSAHSPFKPHSGLFLRLCNASMLTPTHSAMRFRMQCSKPRAAKQLVRSSPHSPQNSTNFVRILTKSSW